MSPASKRRERAHTAIAAERAALAVARCHASFVSPESTTEPPLRGDESAPTGIRNQLAIERLFRGFMNQERVSVPIIDP